MNWRCLIIIEFIIKEENEGNEEGKEEEEGEKSSEYKKLSKLD